MIQLLSLAEQLRLVGFALVVMGLVHIVLPRLLDWPADLSGTTLLTRQVSYAHLFFIGAACVVLGALPLFCAPELLGGTPLSTVLLAGQTAFWGLRWAAQFVYFSPLLWRGKPLFTLGHVALAVLWTWVTGVFAVALARSAGWG
ncbi:hypothetical protein ACIPRD_07480 [Streptomyces sp. NPDC090108]|uniref:hypothetical protein n=1 Tax=Streptomyces sp. NPDC090108 TaxID=3365947 RepID=UPI00380D8DDC